MKNLSFLKYSLKSISNIHRQGDKKNIFLFATPRGGSTWVMEIIASQPGFKYYDEPFNIRRENVKKTNLFNSWDTLMPEYSGNDAVISYLKMLETNKLRFMNPPPFRKNHKFITNRIVFKIHELEHMINEIKNKCNGYILYLLRHPVANTISRSVFPRLSYFVDSSYYQNLLSSEQQKEIKNIFNRGTTFQKGILSWCYENILQLKHLDTRDWTIISYEEILLNPVRSCEMLKEKLFLDNTDLMLKSIDEPAVNISMSNKDTIKIMKSTNHSERRKDLVEKWKLKVSEKDEMMAFDILALFEIDTYVYDRFVATSRYLNFSDTMAKFA